MYNHKIDQHLKEMANVTRDENFFIRKIEQNNEIFFTAEILISSSHEYLYEYKKNCNHITSTAFIESACQIIRTCLHKFYNTEKDNQLTLKSANMHFKSWAFTDDLMIVDVIYFIESKTTREHQEKNFNLKFYQKGNLNMEIDISCFCLSQKVQERLIEMTRQNKFAA